MLYTKNSHALAGLGVCVIGGAILWAYTNLGVTFFALLVLVFLNVLVALFEKDLQSAIHKWLKLTGSVVLATVIPMFSYSAKISWSMYDTRILLGAVFVALATATLPDLVYALKMVSSKLGVSKRVTSLEVALLQKELDKYKSLAEQQMQSGQAVLPNQTQNGQKP